jgi:hypothetical protein
MGGEMNTIIQRSLPYYYEVCPPSVAQKINSSPPGVVGVATAFLGRYREFDICLTEGWFPPESDVLWCMGVDPCHHFNSMVEDMYSDPQLQWVWILGDDHTFTQDLWFKLYERDVDIVVPLCLKRDRIPRPLLENGPEPTDNYWDWIEGKSGLMEWNGDVGNAGMLIRRHVFDKIEPPWFRAGRKDPGYSSSDLNFCRTVHELGFKIYVDLDNTIGHIQHYSVWPQRDEDGSWSVVWR